MAFGSGLSSQVQLPSDRAHRARAEYEAAMWLQVVEVTRVHPALGHVFGMYGRRNTALASEQQRPHLFEQQLPTCALVVEGLLLNSKPAARPPATRARLRCAIRLKVKISSNNKAYEK